MKLVFCGTPDFAVPTLEAVLAAGHDVALVLTQPDRPSGRRMELHEPPVKRLARDRGLEVFQPERIKANEDLRGRLERIRPDVILVVAYGRIIPQWMLDLPPLGNINLHGSLLPKYRGAAPVQWAVANGETETGVTTMRLDAGLDTGDMLLSARLAVPPAATAQELLPSLADLGAGLMLKTLQGLQDGTVTPRSQDHRQATLAPILTREDGRMDLENGSALETYNRWRGFYPWPGAYAMFRGRRFLVHRMHPTVSLTELSPGELAGYGEALLVGARGGTALVLEEVQMEGRPKLAGNVFARSFQLKRGERLERA
jgi:methionyl-tRNA formyltransferase